ncbi:unnamed protein product [Protopolystoma xenopodis]|uniref:TIR domain-containing protein n=1 Tax=Protopolystoma xenopodis TaxID=117903 RepID=A0A3S5B0U5_9PLAT|nr:unnamed protein product [Protopolystoma xenopodis]
MLEECHNEVNLEEQIRSDKCAQFCKLINSDVCMTITEEGADVFSYFREQSNLMTQKSCMEKWLISLLNSADFVSFYTQYIQLLVEKKNGSNYLADPRCRAVTNFIKLHMLTWNATDKSEELCYRLVTASTTMALIHLIKQPELEPTICFRQRNVSMLLHSAVGILNNVINHLPNERSKFREEGIVQALMLIVKYDSLHSHDFYADHVLQKLHLPFKTASLLLLAFMVDEKENDILNDTDGHIIYLIAIVKDALLNEETLFSVNYGYNADELFYRLKHLAGPDSNKEILVKNGIIGAIKSALDISLKQERASITRDNAETSYKKYRNLALVSLDLLWSLSFMEITHQHLACGTDFRRICDHFAESPLWQGPCKLAATGILWNLKCAENISTSNSSPAHLIKLMGSDRSIGKADGHVMISYQHSTQHIMSLVKDALERRGYKVWMDIDHMRGSFVDAMADGIQRSAALVLGISQAFKNSPHCRQEVRYAYSLGIPLVPLVLEPNFRSDGWLGLLLATILMHPLTGHEDLERAANWLEDQLGDRGRHQNAPSEAPVSILESGSEVAQVPSGAFSEPVSQSITVDSHFGHLGICAANHVVDYEVIQPLDTNSNRLVVSGAKIASVNSFPSYLTTTHSERSNLIQQCYEVPNKYPCNNLDFSLSTTIGQEIPALSVANGIQPLLPVSSLANGMVVTTNSDLPVNLASFYSPSSSNHGFSSWQCFTILFYSRSYTISSEGAKATPQTLSTVDFPNWTSTEVVDWLSQHKLSSFLPRLAGLDGRLLVELVYLRLHAPEGLMTILSSDLGMGLIDRLRLLAALADLAK